MQVLALSCFPNLRLRKTKMAQFSFLSPIWDWTLGCAIVHSICTTNVPSHDCPTTAQHLHGHIMFDLWLNLKMDFFGHYYNDYLSPHDCHRCHCLQGLGLCGTSRLLPADEGPTAGREQRTYLWRINFINKFDQFISQASIESHSWRTYNQEDASILLLFLYKEWTFLISFTRFD